MNKYAAGTTIRIEAEITDHNDTLTDPDSIKVSVYKGEVTEVDLQDMTKVSTGLYYYNWQSSADDTVGKYDVKVTLTSDGKTSIKKEEETIQLF